MVKVLLVVGTVVLVLILIALVVGWSLPVKHTASRRATLAAPPEAVWKALTDIEAFPHWRGDVTKVERLPDRDGRAAWVEAGSNGRITFVVERSEPPRFLVSRIADPTLPFGGTWTYTLTPEAGGTTLVITENGEIYNPIFRVMSRFVFGYEATMASFVRNLEARVAGRLTTDD